MTYNEEFIAFYYVDGDTKIIVPFRFSKAGVAVDFSIYSSVKFRLRRCDGTLIEVIGVMDTNDHTLMNFTLDTGVVIAGRHNCEIVLATSAGGVDKYPKRAPLTMQVRPSV